MSGGHFDYAYYKAQEFADSVRDELERAGQKNKYGDVYSPYSPETLATLRDIADLAEITSRLMKEAEWLYSGDTGEETFSRYVEKIYSDLMERFGNVPDAGGES